MSPEDTNRACLMLHVPCNKPPMDEYTAHYAVCPTDLRNRAAQFTQLHGPKQHQEKPQRQRR
eukprot:5994274-Amphidinium_carterae.1